MTVPADVVRAFRLSAGDSVFWSLEENGAYAKFFRVTAPAERVQESTHAQEGTNNEL
jgi:hypothetical protein